MNCRLQNLQTNFFFGREDEWGLLAWGCFSILGLICGGTRVDWLWILRPSVLWDLAVAIAVEGMTGWKADTAWLKSVKLCLLLRSLIFVLIAQWLLSYWMKFFFNPPVAYFFLLMHNFFSGKGMPAAYTFHWNHKKVALIWYGSSASSHSSSNGGRRLRLFLVVATTAWVKYGH